MRSIYHWKAGPAHCTWRSSCYRRHAHAPEGRRSGQRRLRCSSEGKRKDTPRRPAGDSCLLPDPCVRTLDDNASGCCISSVLTKPFPCPGGGNGYTNGHHNVSLSISSDEQVTSHANLCFGGNLRCLSAPADEIRRCGQCRHLAMQEGAQQQQQSQYTEESGDSQQPSDGSEQEEQQARQDAPLSSAGRIGFIGAGQV